MESEQFEVNQINQANIKMLDNLKKFTKLLDIIELSINEKLEKDLANLKAMVNTIDENNTIFRKICENCI
jgi:hypothetical protein